MNIHFDTKFMQIGQLCEVLGSRLQFQVFNGGHLENGRHFVRHYEFWRGQWLFM